MKRKALITGASRGIGRAIALEFARMGHDIIGLYHSRDDAAASVSNEINALGTSARMIKVDVADPTATKAVMDELVGAGIQILVNNAGITRDMPLPAMDFETWSLVTRTSLDGFFNITQPLIMPMIHSPNRCPKWGRGRIITLSSVSGVMGNRGQVHYAAAKAGLIGASKSLALEVAKRNITVNVIAPGPIETDMLVQAEDAGTPLEEVKKAIPVRRFGTDEEVAKMAAYLISDDAAFVTGQTFHINGGLYM